MRKRIMAGLLCLPGCAMEGTLVIHKPDHVRACNGPAFAAPPPPVILSEPPGPAPQSEPAPIDTPPPVLPPAVEVDPTTSWKPVRRL